MDMVSVVGEPLVEEQVLFRCHVSGSCRQAARASQGHEMGSSSTGLLVQRRGIGLRIFLATTVTSKCGLSHNYARLLRRSKNMEQGSVPRL